MSSWEEIGEKKRADKERCRESFSALPRKAKGGGTATSYTANDLNQYTSTTDPSENFTYDDGGNLTDDADYDYVWNGENRLIRIEPTGTPASASPGLGTPSKKKLST